MENIKALEARYEELDRQLAQIEWEEKTARDNDCGEMVVGVFDEEWERISTEANEIYHKLKAIWKADPAAVSAEWNEAFLEGEKTEEALKEMAWLL